MTWKSPKIAAATTGGLPLTRLQTVSRGASTRASVMTEAELLRRAAALTERRKADREQMAVMVEALCAEKGARVERTERERMIRLEISLGEGRVGIEFDGGPFNSLLDYYCMPWNTADRSHVRMTDTFGLAVGAEVNPHHRAKCMGFADGIYDLIARLGRAMDCINAGKAFEVAAGASND